MKLWVFILLLVYILSPVDLLPGIPIDDVLAAIGAAAFLLAPRDT